MKKSNICTLERKVHADLEEKKCEVVHICICKSQNPRDNRSPKYLPNTQTDHIQKIYI